MAAKSDDTYALDRSVLDSKRLDVQHDFMTHCLGYDLHPAILNKLAKSKGTLCVADIATGTGIFLRHLSRQPLFSKAKLDGFDISTSQFPNANDLPNNITLRTHDIKVPFPQEYHSRYDVIYIRLVCAALGGDEWTLVARNLMQLLKPGGVLQWVEYDLFSSGKIFNASPQSTRQYLQPFLDAFTKASMARHIWHRDFHLAGYLLEAGYQDVLSERYSNGGNGAARRVWKDMMKLGARSQPFVWKMVGIAEDEIEEHAEGMVRDIDSGSFNHMEVLVAIGWKAG